MAPIVDNLLGGGELGAEVRDRILEAAAGNPLFVEQMLTMLVDDGTLRLEDGRWRPTIPLSEITVPPTIQALLTARVEQLEHDERAVIEPVVRRGLPLCAARRRIARGRAAQLERRRAPRLAHHQAARSPRPGGALRRRRLPLRARPDPGRHLRRAC